MADDLQKKAESHLGSAPPPEAALSRTEAQAMPERAPELLTAPEFQKAEERESFLDETLESLKQTLKRSKKPTSGSIPAVRDAMTVRVEHIMEEGLEDAYRAMTVVQQQEFKIQGEETARQIRSLLKAAHVKVKKVFRLILEWLRLIPGVNKFFLMQEAKIKTDRIVALKESNTGRAEQP